MRDRMLLNIGNTRWSGEPTLRVGFEVGRREEERGQQLTSVSRIELASAAEAQRVCLAWSSRFCLGGLRRPPR